MKILIGIFVFTGLLCGEIHLSKNEKILLGSGIVFGAVAHKQVGQVLKVATSSIVHPVAEIKKVRAKTK